jgi:pre-rRNA-processing protein TSR3
VDPLEILIIRLNKESPKKCSLTPLRRRGEPPVRWFHCDLGDPVEVGEVTLLHPEGEPLTPADAGRPLLLVDSSWRDLPRMLATVEGTFHRRALPSGLRTAYPRKSSLFQDPDAGLASIEALHAALAMLGRRNDGLLEGYHWAEDWLAMNRELLAAPLG